MKRLTISLLLCLSAVATAFETPTNLRYERNARFSWVLIHSEISFLIPAYTPASQGDAAVSWSPVAGAAYYQYRLFVNGAWTSWVKIGTQAYVNLTRLGVGIVTFEVVACDISTCELSAPSNIAQISINMSEWVNIGQCDPSTGKQLQRCVNSQYCRLNALREIQACSVVRVDCSK